MSTNTARAALVKPATSEFYDVTIVNSNSDKIDLLLGFTPCTSSTRPSAPITGQGALESDTGAAIVSNGSAPASGSWSYLHGTSGFTTVGATGATAALRIQTTGTVAGNRCIDFRKQGDANAAFIQDFDGKMQWGPGGGTNPDTTLYRTAAATLKTDGALTVVGAVSALGVNLPLGQISQVTRTTPVNGISTTDTVTDSVTFTAVAGRRYRLSVSLPWDGSVTGDQYTMSFRYQAGASLTNAGTLFHQVITGCLVGGVRHHIYLTKSINGIAAGQTSIGLTVVRASGTGVFNAEGAATVESILHLDDIGT